MRFSSVCSTCATNESIHLNARPAPQGGKHFELPQLAFCVGEVGEDFVTVMECGFGHRHLLLGPPLDHFEMLTRSAIDAFNAGYFGETVMDLMAAVEKAYEFFCQVVSHAHGIDNETFDNAWKSLGKLSERRLGWFAATWLSEATVPYKLPQRIIELRNEAIHNGSLPSRAQAVEVGEWAISIMFDISELLRGRYPENITERRKHNAIQRRNRLSSKVKNDPNLRALKEHSIVISSIYGLNQGPSYKRRDFHELVKELGAGTIIGINPKISSAYGMIDFPLNFP